MKIVLNSIIVVILVLIFVVCGLFFLDDFLDISIFVIEVIGFSYDVIDLIENVIE